ncbi:tRNA (guanine(10)-N(2))-dimethyltransferase [Candidatus Bathyarchaeota archaeon]|nr:tRNA (guanine(10)-N(2))-dimethyltransferase [Candidatus Bathyarchaeota archaeon]
MKEEESTFSFPTETVREGATSVLVPKLEAFVEEAWEYAPSKSPVFYNPVMGLNRDLAVLASQAHQEMLRKKISLCEPLTGCGIRGVRLAREVEGVDHILLNDINEEAVKLARFNIQSNKLGNKVSVMNEDANLLLSRYAAPYRRFDYIDVDPFGSPVPYLDSAIRALRSQGLIALTATDLAPLCGVHPKACVRKYGGRPLRTEYCHELAVRLLAGCLTRMAAKHDIGVRVVFSHGTDHYIRVYAVGHYGARRADDSIQKLGYILHCFSCLHREALRGIFSILEEECPECGSRINIAGPLWLDPILDEEFCDLMHRKLRGRKLENQKRVLKLLSSAKYEAEAPPTYYVTDKICDKLNLPIPPLKSLIKEVRGEGFQATPTHFSTRGIRTDAPATVVREAVTRLVDR